MKLDRSEIYKKYMKWVRSVTKTCDWKSTFGPKEIVDALCTIIENTQTPTLYLCYHHPSQKWVQIRKNSLQLVDTPKKASFYASKNKLEEALKKASFLKEPQYGLKNFLEFETFQKAP